MSRSWHAVSSVEIAFPFSLAFTADFCLCGDLFLHYCLSFNWQWQYEKLKNLAVVSGEPINLGLLLHKWRNWVTATRVPREILCCYTESTPGDITGRLSGGNPKDLMTWEQFVQNQSVLLTFPLEFVTPKVTSPSSFLKIIFILYIKSVRCLAL